MKPGEKLVERVDPGINDPGRPSRAGEQLRRDSRGQVPGSDADDEQRSRSRPSVEKQEQPAHKREAAQAQQTEDRHAEPTDGDIDPGTERPRNQQYAGDQ